MKIGVYGNGADNFIHGGNGADFLYGDEGNDLLIGGDGDDYLSGFTGSNQLTGGAGADIFSISGEELNLSNLIEDFEDGIDTLDLSSFGFTSEEQATIENTLTSDDGNGNVVIDLNGLSGSSEAGTIIINNMTVAEFLNPDSHNIAYTNPIG